MKATLSPKMIAILFFASFAEALDWWYPDPTPDAQNSFAFDGWTPKPTGFLEMAKRQQIPAQDTICGYINGEPDLAIDCSGLPCGYNTIYSWFGCCASVSFDGNSPIAVGCPVVTSCVPYAQLNQCDAPCASDTMITKCTDTASPYCGYGDLVEIPGMTAVGCAPTPFEVPVDVSVTGPAAPTNTAQGTTSNNAQGTASNPAQGATSSAAQTLTATAGVPGTPAFGSNGPATLPTQPVTSQSTHTTLAQPSTSSHTVSTQSSVQVGNSASRQDVSWAEGLLAGLVAILYTL